MEINGFDPHEAAEAIRRVSISIPGNVSTPTLQISRGEAIRVQVGADGTVYTKTTTKGTNMREEILATLRAGLGVPEGALRLAISGPHIDLEDGNVHFYEVQLAYGDQQARTRVNGDALPNGFSYLMESGLDYAEDLICEALAVRSWAKLDPMKELIDGLVESRRTAMIPKVHSNFPRPASLAIDQEVSLGIRVGGQLRGRIVYSPNLPAESRFTYAVWANGCYVPKGSKSTLQEATDAVLQAATEYHTRNRFR